MTSKRESGSHTQIIQNSGTWIITHST